MAFASDVSQPTLLEEPILNLGEFHGRGASLVVVSHSIKPTAFHPNSTSSKWRKEAEHEEFVHLASITVPHYFNSNRLVAPRGDRHDQVVGGPTRP